MIEVLFCLYGGVSAFHNKLTSTVANWEVSFSTGTFVSIIFSQFYAAVFTPQHWFISSCLILCCARRVRNDPVSLCRGNTHTQNQLGSLLAFDFKSNVFTYFTMWASKEPPLREQQWLQLLNEKRQNH